METSTLQKHMARGQQPDTGDRRFYVLDESSLASTSKCMSLCRLHPNDRVLLVGDRRERPEDFDRALQRKPDDIKVVVQFSEV
jgi:hypothetical protein